MNYIELLNRFYDLLQETRVSNNAQLLYYTLLQINNRCSWADWFQRTNVNLSGLMNVSEKAMTNARNELKQLGVIDFIPSKKRGECTKYTLLYPTKCSTKEVQKKYKGSTKEVQSADIIKPKEKDKPKQKSISNDIPEKKRDIEAFFDSVWNLYPVKRGKGSVSLTQKTKLFKIGLDELQRAIERYSSEKKDTEVQFWKNGSTFFNSGYVDYLDANYKPVESKGKSMPKKTGFQNFEERDTDYDGMVIQRLKERLKGSMQEGENSEDN